MGLDLTAVNKNFGYKKIWYDKRTNKEVIKTEDVSEEKGYFYEFEELVINERFKLASMGYIGFMRFRIALAKEYGLDDYYNWIQNFGTLYVESSETRIVITDITQADEEDLKSEQFMKYIQKLDSLKDKKWYALLPLLLHNDSEGYMSLEQVKQVHPKIKKFLQPYIENNEKQFGYSGRDYEWFEKDFLKVLETVIEIEGKLLFS